MGVSKGTAIDPLASVGFQTVNMESQERLKRRIAQRTTFGGLTGRIAR
jgi:hypothetical protein